MFWRFLLAYRTITTIFGRPFRPLGLFVFFSARRALVSVGMWLDPLFYPALRKAPTPSCLVVIGNPRSGTTFLHRFLYDMKIGTGMQVWHMLLPSLVVQRLLGGLIRRLERHLPSKHFSNEAHSTGLSEVDCDDAAVMMHFYDGFMLSPLFRGWDSRHRGKIFSTGFLESSKRDFGWLSQIWKRRALSDVNTVAQPNTIVAKFFSLNERVTNFSAAFPDSKFIYLIRAPLEMIPSGMSLNTIVMDRTFGFWSLPQAKRDVYLESLYLSFIQMPKDFLHAYQQADFPKDRVLLVRYQDLMDDFEVAMDRIGRFAGLTFTDAHKKKIADQAAKQRSHTSDHHYDLAKFGLTEERLRSDTDETYQRLLALSGDAGGR